MSYEVGLGSCCTIPSELWLGNKGHIKSGDELWFVVGFGSLGMIALLQAHPLSADHHLFKKMIFSLFGFNFTTFYPFICWLDQWR